MKRYFNQDFHVSFIVDVGVRFNQPVNRGDRVVSPAAAAALAWASIAYVYSERSASGVRWDDRFARRIADETYRRYERLDGHSSEARSEAGISARARQAALKKYPPPPPPPDFGSILGRKRP